MGYSQSLTYHSNTMHHLMVSKSSRLGSMGRRGFITALTSLGITGQAAGSLTAEKLEKLTSNPRKEVPRIKYYKHTNHDKVEKGIEPPNREPVYYTIPRDQWVRTKTAINAGKK